MLYLRFNPYLAANRHLDELRTAREVLDQGLLEPGPVYGELRRHAVATSVHYSTAIEGNVLTLGQVESLLRGEQVAARDDQVQEVLNYREAISYVQEVGSQRENQITEQTIRTIHFLVSKSLPGPYDPGRYRAAQNNVVDSVSGRVVFRPPPPEAVGSLMQEFIEWLNSGGRQIDPYLRAALAHLNFVAIHPFGDGNGRTARIIEALIFYMEGYKSHELVSLEEFFGRDTQSYYTALNASLGSSYRPDDADVSPWVNYYLGAHAAQAVSAATRQQTVISQLATLTSTFDVDVVRALSVLVAHYDGSITNSIYRAMAGVTNQTAVTHLRQLVNMDLLQIVGRGRGTRYEPTKLVRELFEAVATEVTTPRTGESTPALDPNQPTLL